MPGKSKRRPCPASPLEAESASVHDVQQVWTVPPPPVLPRFNGDDPVEDFLLEARRTMASYNFKPSAAADFVIRHLDGPAKREVLNRDPKTPEDVFKILEDIFGDRRDLQILLQSFHSRRQGFGEGVLEYSHALQALASRVRRMRPNDISEESLRDKFVDGLQPSALRKDVKKFVRDNKGCDMLTTRAEAMRWMREDYDAPVYQEAIGARPSEIENLRSQLEAVSAELHEMKQKQQEGRKEDRVVCHYCKRTGHVKRDCRKRQYNERKGASRYNPGSQPSRQELPHQPPVRLEQQNCMAWQAYPSAYQFAVPQPAPIPWGGMPFQAFPQGPPPCPSTAAQPVPPQPHLGN